MHSSTSTSPSISSYVLIVEIHNFELQRLLNQKPPTIFKVTRQKWNNFYLGEKIVTIRNRRTLHKISQFASTGEVNFSHRKAWMPKKQTVTLDRRYTYIVIGTAPQGRNDRNETRSKLRTAELSEQKRSLTDGASSEERQFSLNGKKTRLHWDKRVGRATYREGIESCVYTRCRLKISGYLLLFNNV